MVIENCYRTLMVYFFWLCCLIPTCFCQNLLSNGSFEKVYEDGPDCHVFKTSEFDKYCRDWNSNKSSPDLITRDDCRYFSTKPKAGDYCLGLLGWSLEDNWMTVNIASESVQSRLIEKLEIDSVYKLDFWLSSMPDDYSVQISRATDKMTQVVYSNNLSFCFYREEVGLKDSLRFCYTLDSICDISTWSNYSVSFKAEAKSDRIWIGNLNPEMTKISSNARSEKYRISYSFIDDIRVVKLIQPSSKKPIDFISKSFNVIIDDFDLDSFHLKSNHKVKLDDLASKAVSDSIYVKVIGHAGSSGSDRYNYDLSLKRAIAVKKYLLALWPDTVVLYIDCLAMGESESHYLELGADRKVEVICSWRSLH